MKHIRIGSGAGFSGDRIDPAVELARLGGLHYLVFECLAERTIALAQKRKRENANEGYDPLLAERMLAVLPDCVKQGITIISNMGAANPRAAAAKTRAIAQQFGLHGLRIAAIEGDDVLEKLDGGDTFMETGAAVESIRDRIVSANAYLGSAPIVEALNADANIILTGRVADPSLFLAPLIHEFAWKTDDWNLLAQGIVIGHLLECAGQLTGGYFADPGFKDVPNLARLGFPLAQVAADGSAVVTKVDGSGGCVTRATCIEQLLYEIQDPTAYYTPDVIADFTSVKLKEIGRDRVEVTGGRGRAMPQTLKVSVGFHDGFVGEGQISYAGPGAVNRAELATEILQERLASKGLSELRFDLIGLNSIHGDCLSRSADGDSSARVTPYEVRLRVAGRASTAQAASIVPREVEALYTSGPAGGGGVTTSVKETLAILSTLMDRSKANHSIHYEVS